VSHASKAQSDKSMPAARPHQRRHGANQVIGKVDHARNGFDPKDILTDWETGEVTTMQDGTRVREFRITAVDKEIEIAPGVLFPA